MRVLDGGDAAESEGKGAKGGPRGPSGHAAKRVKESADSNEGGEADNVKDRDMEDSKGGTRSSKGEDAAMPAARALLRAPKRGLDDAATNTHSVSSNKADTKSKSKTPTPEPVGAGPTSATTKADAPVETVEGTAVSSASRVVLPEAEATALRSSGKRKKRAATSGTPNDSDDTPNDSNDGNDSDDSDVIVTNLSARKHKKSRKKRAVSMEGHSCDLKLPHNNRECD